MLKRNTLMAFRLTILISFFATSISSWQHYGIHGVFGWLGFFNGLIDGFFIGGLLCSYKLILVDVVGRKSFTRLSFLRTLILNSFVYSFLILFGRALGRYIMEYDEFTLFPVNSEIARIHFFQTLVFAFVFSIILNFLLQISRLLGPSVLANFVTGRYHYPIRGERIILFMDLKSSTTIAEKLGDVRYLEFLSETFSDLTEAIIQTNAEIYKYVGDEIILSWSLEKGLQNANCVHLPLLAEKFFTHNKKHYLNRYGHVPQFRTGIHMGEIAIGEVGVLKREIALIGDVMNTSARIAGYCRECAHNFIISSTLKDVLPNKSFYHSLSLGVVTLRGKAEGLELFAISSSTD